jgi:protein-S-isoprenylcysteine O-methyltransferase Ste14
MNTAEKLEQHSEHSELRSILVKGLRRILAMIVLLGAILFISSGQMDWLMAWVFLGINLSIVAVNLRLILPRHPNLIAERSKFMKNARTWDKILVLYTGLAGMISLLVVAGLNERFDWAPRPTDVLQGSALVITILGYALVSWAMTSNQFFSAQVRIQTDRGHTVIRTGPYRYVRHPGYVGAVLYSLGIPLMLESYWALIPGVLLVVMIVVRTILEDKTLQRELKGYREYTRAVKCRLVPGIW